MSVRTSRTRVAKNRGYGGILDYGRFVGYDPHLMDALQKRAAIRKTGGKKISSRKKRGGGYNSAALEGMGYNSAALDGAGYNEAALIGMGYNDAALAGAGIEDLVSTFISMVGPSVTQLVEMIAQKLNESIKQLLNDPEKLLAILKDIAPKAFKKVRQFYEWIKSKIWKRPPPSTLEPAKPKPRPKTEPDVVYTEPEKIDPEVIISKPRPVPQPDIMPPSSGIPLPSIEPIYNNWKSYQNRPNFHFEV